MLSCVECLVGYFLTRKQERRNRHLHSVSHSNRRTAWLFTAIRVIAATKQKHITPQVAITMLITGAVGPFYRSLKRHFSSAVHMKEGKERSATGRDGGASACASVHICVFRARPFLK